MDYHRQNNVDIRIVRIFNTYGPRMDSQDGRVLSNFVVQALRAEPLTLYGKGNQTRSFCYVDDLIEGMIRMMNQQKTVGPINLGNPREISMKALARMVLKATGSRSRIVTKPLPKDDPRRRKPDISLAKKYLAWSPQVPLEDGLEKTIDYFRGILGERDERGGSPRRTCSDGRRSPSQ